MLTNVTLYTKPNCPQCTQVKALFAKHGIEYSTIELNFGQSTTNQLIEIDAFKSQNPGITSMPFFVAEDAAGSTITGGYQTAKTLLG